jgi:hypothetical protein
MKPLQRSVLISCKTPHPASHWCDSLWPGGAWGRAAIAPTRCVLGGSGGWRVSAGRTWPRSAGSSRQLPISRFGTRSPRAHSCPEAHLPAEVTVATALPPSAIRGRCWHYASPRAFYVGNPYE